MATVVSWHMLNLDHHMMYQPCQHLVAIQPVFWFNVVQSYIALPSSDFPYIAPCIAP
jgi:hypothetical protein